MMTCTIEFTNFEATRVSYTNMPRKKKNGQYIRLPNFVSADRHIPVLDPLAAFILASRTWSNPQA